MMTVAHALPLAVQHHRAGRLPEAEGIYRQILAAEPTHAEALYLLGMLAREVGRMESAVELMLQAAAADPSNPHFRLDLGNTLLAQRDLDGAIAAYRAAFELKPDFGVAHSNLSVALREKGQFGEAAEACRRALQIWPDYPDAWYNLGLALHDQGDLEGASDAYRSALRLKPNLTMAQNNLGIILKTKGHPDKAIEAYRLALQIEPNFLPALNNLGAALQDRGQIDDAIAVYRRALQIGPDSPEACNNLGTALAELGKTDEAIAAYEQALRIQPNFATSHYSLGIAFRAQGRLDKAIAAYRRAVEIKPDYVKAHNNLGLVLAEQGLTDEALAEYRCALALEPNHLEAMSNLGNTLKDRGQMEEAIAAYRQALRIKPEDASIHSNLIFLLYFLSDDNAGTISAEHERWNCRFSDPVMGTIQSHTNERSPERALRIGYVSPDFREHSAGRYMLPVLECHDRDLFEIVCYSGVVRPDSMTDRFRAIAHQWRDTSRVPDAKLSEMIREDGVDILVDLSQHTAGNRLPVFARKPAPIQVSYAGCPESAGVDAIGHRISDRRLEAESPAVESETKERVYLIDSFYCYDPCGAEVGVNALPALQNEVVTFGCLNNFCKINQPVLSLWAKVLQEVEHSRLVISSHAGSHRQRTLEALEGQGVARSRVEFVDIRGRREYLELYHRIDIGLDTFPYNGGVTTTDALWMGTPVVTLAGKRPVSRAGVSLLTNVGLPELVAHSEAEYINIARGLARDLPGLAELRSTLRDRLTKSAIMDAPRFTRQVEQAYRSMWQAWCAEASSGRNV